MSMVLLCLLGEEGWMEGRRMQTCLFPPPPLQVFKICLDYWNFFVPDVYSSAAVADANITFSFAGAPPPGAGRRELYAAVLSQLRGLMISRMAKPEEVIVVEDENGNVVRETMKDTDVLARYKTMHETLVRGGYGWDRMEGIYVHGGRWRRGLRRSMLALECCLCLLPWHPAVFALSSPPPHILTSSHAYACRCTLPTSTTRTPSSRCLSGCGSSSTGRRQKAGGPCSTGSPGRWDRSAGQW
jgi:hypothetical protein